MNGEEYLELGLIYVREQAWAKALGSLDQAEQRFTAEKQKVPAALDSFLGLSLAMIGQRLEEALSRCEKAVDEASYQPDYYFNLARVYLALEDKTSAIQALRMGLQLDERHPWITREMKSLGIRNTPVINALPRNHFLNRHLGKIKSRLKLLK